MDSWSTRKRVPKYLGMTVQRVERDKELVILILPNILALLIAIAGWYYLFYSRAAEKLTGVEAPHINLARVRLRRINGFVLLLLAVGIYAGFHTVNTDPPSRAFVYVWTAVMMLLMICVILGMIDLRLTLKLRRMQIGRKRDSNS